MSQVSFAKLPKRPLHSRHRKKTGAWRRYRGSGSQPSPLSNSCLAAMSRLAKP